MVKPRFFLYVAVIAAAFLLFPAIDIAFSGLFFYKGLFVLWKYGVKTMNSVLMNIIITLIVACSIYILVGMLTKKKYGNFAKHAIFIFFVLAITHGFIVNVMTKNTFGRARPLQITEFNGSKKFSKIFVLSSECKKNCSFVSGDTSIAFALVVLVFFAPLDSFITKKRKRVMLDTVFFLSILMSFCRLSLGKHFISDVLFSAVLVFFFSFVFYRLIFGKIEYQIATSDL